MTGDPAEPGTFIGPVIDQRQLDSVLDKVRRPVGQRATLALGGDPVGPAGPTLPPQVLLGNDDVATAREEVFGPAITIMPAANEADPLKMGNDTEYGPSSAVHTRDRE